MISTLLSRLRIWDGEHPHTGDAILVQGERIAAVGSSDELSADTTVDCSGLTALPGLIDAHVHMELNPDDRLPPAQTDLSVAAKARMRERAEAMLEAGITTARDLGGGAWLELTLRDAITAGEVAGPRLLCAGQPITCPSGHCHFWGGEAADTAQADAVIERQLDKGVDLIKVMATGGQLTKGSDPGAAQFDLATLTHIVQRAAAHDKLVAAHCHGTQGIHFAAAAGVSTIEHCSWAGKAGWAADYRPETAALIAERGTWISPTVNRGWQRYLEGRNQQMRERIQGNFAAMRAKEIPFIASTDAGIPGVYHHHLPLALPVFAQIAGLSAEAVLRSATSQAALAIGLHSVTGRIENGLSADLLLVQGNPLIDLSALADPAQVWFRGRPVKSI